jgi:hypothetical protein
MANPKKIDLENPALIPAGEVRRMLAEVRQADRQVKSGHYIKHEDVKAWLSSWGTDRELPVPKCACGSPEF